MKAGEMGRTWSTSGRDNYKMLAEKLGGRRPLGRPKPRWGIILEWVLEKLWTEFIAFRIRTNDGLQWTQ